MKMNVPGVSARDVKVTLTGGCLRDSSKKEDESKLLSSIGVPTSLRIDFLGDERQRAERGGGNVITIKLKRKGDVRHRKRHRFNVRWRFAGGRAENNFAEGRRQVASGEEAERPPAEKASNAKICRGGVFEF